MTLWRQLDQVTEKEDKHYHSLGDISLGGSGGNSSKDKLMGPAYCSQLDQVKVLVSTVCPQIYEVSLLEPLLCKMLSQEHKTMLLFL